MNGGTCVISNENSFHHLSSIAQNYLTYKLPGVVTWFVVPEIQKVKYFPIILHRRPDTLVMLVSFVLTVSICKVKVKVKECVMNTLSEQLIVVILLIISTYFNILYYQIFLTCI